MIFKPFPRLAAALRRLFAANTFGVARNTRRPDPWRTDDAVDARTHARRGTYLGLLVRLDVLR